MKDLNSDLGNGYVREFLVGACFQLGRKAYWLRAATATELTCDTVDLDGKDSDFVRENIPITSLKSFSTFKYPELGYRQHVTDKDGPVVSYFSTTRSAHRGLRFELLKQTFLPVYNYMAFGITEGATIRATAPHLRNLFAPKFTPFNVGIKQLLAGEIGGFAVNEQIAVAVSCTKNGDREYDVYFRDRVVGQVSKYGTVTFSNKVLARTANIHAALK